MFSFSLNKYPKVELLGRVKTVDCVNRPVHTKPICLMILLLSDILAQKMCIQCVVIHGFTAVMIFIFHFVRFLFLFCLLLNIWRILKKSICLRALSTNFHISKTYLINLQYPFKHVFFSFLDFLFGLFVSLSYYCLESEERDVRDNYLITIIIHCALSNTGLWHNQHIQYHI